MFAVRPPGVQLAPYVEQFWYYASNHPHAHEVVLPSAQMQLLVGLSDGWPEVVLTGPATRPVEIQTTAMKRLAGVLFTPGGLRPFGRIPGHTLVDQDVPLDQFWTASGSIRDRLLEAGEPPAILATLATILVERLVEVDSMPLIRAATTALDDGATVKRIVDRVGTSRSTFVRTFADHVGVTPKRYASLARFQRAVRGLAAGIEDLASLAVSCGYYDQSHFTHEFKRFADRTPQAYRPRNRNEPNHVVP